jgi:hypothetical protein
MKILSGIFSYLQIAVYKPYLPMNTEEQLNDRTDGKTFHELQLKRARLAAIVLAMATIISLIFLVFAFVQKEHARKLESELASTKKELEICRNSGK